MQRSSTLIRGKSYYADFRQDFRDALADPAVDTWQAGLRIGATLYDDRFRMDKDFAEIRFAGDEDPRLLSPNGETDSDGQVAANLVRDLGRFGLRDTPEIRGAVRWLCQEVDALLKDGAQPEAIQGAVTMAISHIERLMEPAAA